MQRSEGVRGALAHSRASACPRTGRPFAGAEQGLHQDLCVCVCVFKSAALPAGQARARKGGGVAGAGALLRRGPPAAQWALRFSGAARRAVKVLHGGPPLCGPRCGGAAARSNAAPHALDGPAKGHGWRGSPLRDKGSQAPPRGTRARPSTSTAAGGGSCKRAKSTGLAEQVNVGGRGMAGRARGVASTWLRARVCGVCGGGGGGAAGAGGGGAGAPGSRSAPFHAHLRAGETMGCPVPPPLPPLQPGLPFLITRVPI